MDLTKLGWNDHFAAALSGHSNAGLIPARVVSGDRNALVVVTPEGEQRATISGRMLHLARDSSELPRIGDWVALSPVAGEAKGVIRHVLPRRTRLGRRLPGRETREQVLAANVDTAFIVQAMDSTFNPRRMERFLAMTHDGGVRPVVLLNKVDLCDDPEEFLRRTREVSGDTPVVVCSARTRRGLGLIRGHLVAGETVVFVGSSGVGKSSLVNCLYGERIQATIAVREGDSKGRHTTSSRELIPLDCGALVIDTPGLRELQVWLEEEGLEVVFAEIRELALKCRFRDCSHADEPDCAVRRAADEGRLPRARFEAYRKLQKEQRQLADDRQRHARVLIRRQGRIRPRIEPSADDDG
ncbi:MAG: ribosome small subunit-dependent GTPase A [Verrucomicrobiales bacterium]|nr:ribosome small subunit-dependent GTPase A [Verrucomicrobiales bacterium]